MCRWRSHCEYHMTFKSKLNHSQQMTQGETIGCSLVWIRAKLFLSTRQGGEFSVCWSGGYRFLREMHQRFFSRHAKAKWVAHISNISHIIIICTMMLLIHFHHRQHPPHPSSSTPRQTHPPPRHIRAAITITKMRILPSRSNTCSTTNRTLVSWEHRNRIHSLLVLKNSRHVISGAGNSLLKVRVP